MQKVGYYPEGLLFKDIEYDKNKNGEIKGIKNIMIDKDDPEFIMNKSDTLYYIDPVRLPLPVLDYLYELNNRGYIHLGMRNAKAYVVNKLDFITLNTNKGKVWIILDNSNNLFTRIESIEGDENYEYKPLIGDKLHIKYPILKNYEIIDLTQFNQSIVDKLGEGKLVRLGFDFETANRLSEEGFPLQGKTKDEFVPLGFALVNKHYGVYIDFRKYQDFNSKEWDFMHKFIKSNSDRLIAYNCQFEMQSLMHMWDEFFEIHDAMVMVNCDDFHSSPEGGFVNLKISSQKYNHAPSWDDELDDEMELWKRIIHKDYKLKVSESRSNQELLDEIIRQRVKKSPEYTEEEIRNIYRENMKLKYLLHNSWGLAFPPTLAKYCILDAFYTLHIYETLLKMYPKCEDVYHKNMWLGTMLHSNPIPINRSYVLLMYNRNRWLHKFSKMTVLHQYLKFLKVNLKPYLDKFKVDDFTKKVLEFVPEFINDNPVSLMKNIVKKCIANKDESYSLIKSVYGSEKYLEFMSEFTDVDPSTKLRSRKVWTELTKSVPTTEHVVHDWNKLMLDELRPTLKGWNKSISDELSEFDLTPFDMEIVLFLTKNIDDYSSMKSIWGTADHNKLSKIKEIMKRYCEDIENIFQEDIDIFNDNWNRLFSLTLHGKLYLAKDITPKDVYLHKIADIPEPRAIDDLSAIDYMNVYPTQVLYEHVKSGRYPIFNFKCLMDYYTLLNHEKELDDFVNNKTLIQEDSDWKSDNEWWNDFYSASEQQKFDIMYNAMLYYKHEFWVAYHFYLLSHRDAKYDICRELPKDAFESMFNASNSQSNEDLTKMVFAHMISNLKLDNHNTILHPNHQTISSTCVMNYSSYGFINNYGDDYIPSGISKDAYKFDEVYTNCNNKSFKDYSRFFMLYKLESMTEKMLNPYIDRFMEDSFKSVYEGRFESVLDKSQPGDSYVVRYDVNTKKTKRLASYFHTIPGKSEAKNSVTVNDGRIISYFDVSDLAS